ncbi:hydantoinase B/oxoprolinase, partial [Helicosporidium sp. ATCC 50920]
CNAWASRHGAPAKSVDEVALGFVAVANEAMCRPIRALTQMRGYDASKHVLACFGGAGAQHACAVAQALGIKTVFVHRCAGILSAVGIGLAEVVHEAREPLAESLGCERSAAVLEEKLASLETRVRELLAADGFRQDAALTLERFANLRYDGTDEAIMTRHPGRGSAGLEAAFVEAYRREFGFVLENRAVLVDDVRVRGAGLGSYHEARRRGETGDAARAEKSSAPVPLARTSAYFALGGRQDTPVFDLGALEPGARLPGPAIVLNETSTIVVEPACVAHVTEAGHVRIEVGCGGARDELPTAMDPIQLAVFSHRFMGIAEQMGRVLQRTSVSVNIKERLDFSCALFDSQGRLVSNAPHLPVHLGAMSEAVKFQIRYYGPGGPGEEQGLREGDVLVANHPQLAGGSHLPDITVITPVYEDGEVVFFVASRGHHADVGGIAPGSMPPLSTRLDQEGAAIVSFKVVQQGVFREQGLADLLLAPGKGPDPTVSGTRNLSDNVSDVKAQVAANTRGIALVKELVLEYGLPVVLAYMGHIQAAAEAAVREMLCAFSEAQGLPEVGTVRALDRMDDGSPIALAVTVDRRSGSAVFDFSETGAQINGNLNAPPAVTHSAIIYALRCMVTRDIPLNHGCMAPIEVRLPPRSILSPDADLAVVGGNVLTSQRVTDVVLKAFSAAAASQGCMNNFTFGDEGMGYYETVAGGAGAGPGWHGRSGVHTHMTNTRITDPEIFERTYPVALRRFSLRRGSGGDGLYRGGDGVEREVEFLRPITASILSERRAFAPFGLLGGGPGARGRNLWLRADGGVVSLGGKATVQVSTGDRILIQSPGGGGYGPSRALLQGAARSDDDAVLDAETLHAPPPSKEALLDLQRRVEALAAARGVVPAVPPARSVGSLHKYHAGQHSA